MEYRENGEIDPKELMDAEVLDVEDAAKILGVGPRVVYSLLKKGRLPGLKVGRTWRLHRSTLLKWLSEASEAEANKRRVESGDSNALKDMLNKGKARVK